MQQEILQYLESENRPLTALLIAEGMNANVLSVRRALGKLTKYKEVDFCELSQEEATLILEYPILRRVTIYYPIGYKFIIPNIN